MYAINILKQRAAFFDSAFFKASQIWKRRANISQTFGHYVAHPWKLHPIHYLLLGKYSATCLCRQDLSGSDIKTMEIAVDELKEKLKQSDQEFEVEVEKQRFQTSHIHCK